MVDGFIPSVTKWNRNAQSLVLNKVQGVATPYATIVLKHFSHPTIPGLFVGLTVGFSSHFTRFLTPERIKAHL
jgi:hypothetical protein